MAVRIDPTKKNADAAAAWLKERFGLEWNDEVRGMLRDGIAFNMLDTNGGTIEITLLATCTREDAQTFVRLLTGGEATAPAEPATMLPKYIMKHAAVDDSDLFPIGYITTIRPDAPIPEGYTQGGELWTIADHQELFDAIGHTYDQAGGIVEGSFRLPDLREYPVAKVVPTDEPS